LEWGSERYRTGGDLVSLTKRSALLVLSVGLAVSLVGCGQPKTVALPGVEVSPGSGTQPAGTVATPDDAKLVVQDSQFFSKGKSGSSYGIVLNNTSTDSDAVDIELSVNYLDKSGQIVGSGSSGVSVVPAGQTFFVGNDAFPDEPASKIEVEVSIGSWESAAAKLVDVSNLKIKSEQYFGSRVTGVVTNSTGKTLSTIAKINIVLFDAQGKMVGAGYTFPPFDLKPGKKCAFDAGNGVGIAPANKVKRIGASVDGDFTE